MLSQVMIRRMIPDGQMPKPSIGALYAKWYFKKSFGANLSQWMDVAAVATCEKRHTRLISGRPPEIAGKQLLRLSRLIHRSRHGLGSISDRDIFCQEMHTSRKLCTACKYDHNVDQSGITRVFLHED